MPLIRCPSCKTVFTAGDADRGGVKSCPSCAKPCRIPAASPTRVPGSERSALASAPLAATEAPEDDRLEEVDELEEVDADDESVSLEVVRRGRERKKRPVRRRPDGDLDRVNLGLGFYYAGVLALLAGMAAELAAFVAGLVAVGNAVAGSRNGAGAGVGLAFLLNTIALILIDGAAPLLGLIGSVLCLWAPSAYGARGFSIASLSLNGFALLTGLFGAAFLFVPAAAALGLLAVIPVGLMTFVAWCLFMTFLRQLCLHIGEEMLADESMSVMYRGIFILVLTPIVFLFGMLLTRALGCTGAMVFFVILLFGLYGVFLFLRRQLDLIGSVRQVIATRF